MHPVLSHFLMIAFYIAVTLVLLGLCVFVHELGHLLGGKLVGIKARVFSLGFGKGIIKKEFGGTTYQIAPIPLGGYCSFYGESAGEDREGKDYEFLTAAPWRRIVTVAAGPFFNLVFGVILFFVMNLVGYMSETNRILIPEYVKSGEYTAPAFSAGLASGDRILSINGKTIYTFSDIQNSVVFSSGKSLAVEAERNGERIKTVVTPKRFSEKGYPTIGVVPFGTRIQVAGLVEKEPAAAAGLQQMDEIVSVNGEVITGTERFVSLMRSSAGKKLDIEISRAGKKSVISATPRLREALSVEKAVQPKSPKDGVTVITDNMSAVKDGIAKGTVKFNGAVIKSFDQLLALIKASEGKSSTLDNANSSYTGVVKYEAFGFLGVEPALAPDMQKVQYGIGTAFVKAFVDPYDFVVMNLKGLGMLVSGKLNVRENLSGPIRIGKIAGDTAYYRGASAFVVLMAKISIILMIMNLLPIPAVDGSFIIFFTIEWIIRRPLNEKLMERVQMVGFIFIILLSVFVIFNDLSFFPFFQKIVGLFK
jgi:regulator of sigma E protease